MEVGPGAQAWGRLLRERGIEVRLYPAQHVKAHRSGDKNDLKDTRAILRTRRDRGVHAVPIKSLERLTIQALHRARAGWLKRRTTIVNQVRGLLLEHGIAMARGGSAFERRIEGLLEDATQPLPDRLRGLLDVLRQEYRQLSGYIAPIEAELEQLSRSDPDARRLLTIRGFGPLISTALACKELDPHAFGSSRQFAAYFGCVPNQHSSGSRVRLGKMSKRGDRYVYSAALNGAHAVLRQLKIEDHSAETRRLRRWRERHGAKGAAVRLVNRNFRIAWALLKRGVDYRPRETTNESN